MGKAFDQIVDTLDIETFFACTSEEQAKSLSEELIRELQLPHGDVVFLEFLGYGARVRIRSYIHHPGDHYHWLKSSEVQP